MLSFTKNRLIALFATAVTFPFVFLVDFLANLYYWWYEKQYLEVGNKAVLISGCDSGFGKLAAALFAKNGVKTFAGCLTKDGVKALEDEGNPGLKPFLMDVSSAESTQNAYDLVTRSCEEEGNVFWAVVCNAGTIHPRSPADWFDCAEYERILRVNTLGHIRTVTTFLPLIKRSKGRVVITVSCAGVASAPGLTPYSVSKWGILAFVNGLRVDLYKRSINLAAVCPEVFPTPIVHAMHNVEAKWNELSQDLKDEYPLDHVRQAHHTSSQKINEMGAANNPMDVAECYYHAAFGKVPRMTYFLGRMAPLYDWVSKLPDYLQFRMNAEDVV